MPIYGFTFLLKSDISTLADVSSAEVARVRVGKKSRVVRALRGGQITIPALFRKQLGIEADGLLRITLDKDELRVRPVLLGGEGTGSPWLKELYDQFAQVREEAKRYSEKEIDAAIDRAVKAVRKRHA